MPKPKPNPVPDGAAAPSSMPPITDTTSETMGLPGSGAAMPVGTPSSVGGYVLLSELGRGGMGIVYRAEDPRLKREVAIKLMLPQHAANPQAKARFIREARAQAKVEHDHVAVIHQVNEHEGLPYLVMPLLKGMTLHAALKANPRPPLPEVIRMGREIAEGLAAAHEKGLIHRDIKPANIWLEGKKLRVKVLDFGLARVESEADSEATDDGHLTKEGAVLGTPAYMSPEQARAMEVDHRTDLWSLGAILYQMTTGQLPFRGPNTIAILASLALDTPQPPSALNPAVPPALSDFIMRLLAKDVAYRTPSAEVAVEELRAIETGLVNAVRVIPLDSPPPLIVDHGGPDPFANLDSTETSVSDPGQPASVGDRRPEPAPSVRGESWRFAWVLVAGVLLGAGGIVWFVAGELGKKGDGAIEERAKSGTPQTDTPPTPLRESSFSPGEQSVLKFGYPASDMQFRWIPAGTFKRGEPAREITISKGFWMAETECTQAQWRAVMKANPAPSTSRTGGAIYPVESVSAIDADEFCRELAKLTSKSIRLPSEAEWEYACRARTKTEYHTGDGDDALKRAGWYQGNAGRKLHPVGELAANAWGLRDMHGNVAEWCQDGYEVGYYATSPAVDPVCTIDLAINRVFRGGSWDAGAARALAASRDWAAPTRRVNYIGFRVCFRPE